MNPKKLLALAAMTVSLAGCRVGPNYVKPSAPTAPAFKEDSEWKAATPNDAMARGKWWEMYNDQQLNALEEQIDPANQTLKQAEANFRAARNVIRQNRADLAPTLSVDPTLGATRISANQPYRNNLPTSSGQGNFVMPLDLTYEIDLWGRVRRAITSAQDTTQAYVADLETARLSLHAELAMNYFNLRSADAQKKLLDETVAAYKDALQLTTDRADGGVAPESDVAQARTQLQQALVQSTEVTIARAQYEHSIAVLIGKPPADLSIPVKPLTESTPGIPAIPGVLPSELLERRPDIAAQERRMAAANEQIGIAKSAFYPRLNLAADAGFTGNSMPTWFLWTSRIWAVSPQFSEQIFDAGRRRARTNTAVAQYDATVASYRQSALTAFQQVEDNLVALKQLETEAQQQREATQAAEEALGLFRTRYEGGVDTYLQVITSQTTALQNQRNEIDILRRRLDASILLIKATGGGWDTSKLPQFPKG
ncbi:efflux transporter outer membrane subunit [Terriglobus tenax]|uniref:efflux transporter outer membrane subunit n=1 Tax=Terriglobus tenax TaxID=1111115 RepID=UPI0021DFE5AB|nr:efflux transporter outer membrane subunit [Terriglobus tenax]